MIDPGYVAGLSTILFFIGLAGAFTRKHAIIVLMCIEIMLNAVNLNFVAVSMQTGNVEGWVFISIAIAIAAAEVAVGLSIIVALFRARCTVHVDDLNSMKG